MNKDGWTLMKVGDFATECREKNKNNAYSEVRTVSARMGIVNQTDYFNNEVASKDVSGYKVVRKHNFAYRPMGIDIGTLGMSEESEPVLVSPAYVVFKVDETVCRSKYLLYYLKSQDGSNQLNSLLEPGIRIRFPFSYMAKVTIPVPSLQEQDEIIESLSHLDSLISVKGGEVSLMTNMKQQLMNDIFNTSTDGLQRETWRKVKLGDICKIRTGKLNANAAVENGQYPFFTCAEEVSRIDTYAFDCDALTVAGNGQVGLIHDYNGKFNAYQRTYVLSDFTEDKQYIKYYLKQYLPERIAQEMKGGSIPYIKIACLYDMDIILPPLSIQHKISSILSAYDSLISSTDDKSSNLRLAKQQLMNNIFSERESNKNLVFTDTWRKVKLGDIVNITCGKLNANCGTENGQYPFFTANISEHKMIDEYTYNCEAVLMARNGSAGFAKYYSGKFNTSNHCFAITKKNDASVDMKFLYFVINGIYSDISELKHGGGIPGISKTQIADIDVYLPSLPEQLQISSILSDYDMLIESERESESILRKAKTQLMSEIFNRV